MTSAPAPVELSVVAPVFNDEECLAELHSRLTTVLGALTPSYEIILVDDGSHDASWDVVEALSRKDPRVRGVRLSRNFGQHFAITAGLEATRGQRVVVMDSDLQERPEEIPRFWEKMNEGYEVVFSLRRQRRDSFFKRTTSVLFFVAMNRLTGQRVRGEEGTLSMLDRKVVDAFLRVTDVHRHYLYILRYIGFRQAFVDVEHAERFAGTSSYDLKRMFIHALDGITSQSTRLLQASSAIGFLFVIGAFAQVLWLIYKRKILDQGVEGWASAMVSTWFIGGMVLFSLGVLGLYVGKMFEQTKNRPLFIVAERTYAIGSKVHAPNVDR
jgi:glycosyltransferase involved in cell wall biosynthesis